MIWAAPVSKAELKARFQVTEALKQSAAAKTAATDALAGEALAGTAGVFAFGFSSFLLVQGGVPRQEPLCRDAESARTCRKLDIPGEGGGSSARAKPTSKVQEGRPPDPTKPALRKKSRLRRIIFPSLRSSPDRKFDRLASVHGKTAEAPSLKGTWHRFPQRVTLQIACI